MSRLVFLVLFFVNTVNAGTTIGVNMGSSTMNSAPVENSSTQDEQTFEKNSMMLFAQRSIKDRSLIFTTKTEFVQIGRNEYQVLETKFPKSTNQGVRSVDMDIMWYTTKRFGWRAYTKFGYNTKGYEKNSDIKFALANGEMYFGIALMANRVRVYSQLQKEMRKISNGIFGVEDGDFFRSMEIYKTFGKRYVADNIVVMQIIPYNSKVAFKILGKAVDYHFYDDAPRKFMNEAKILGGLIFKTQYHNMVEFSIFYNNTIKEKGAALGYYYYFDNNQNAISDTFDDLLQKYDTKSDKKAAKQQKDGELRDKVQDILNEMGY